MYGYSSTDYKESSAFTALPIAWEEDVADVSRLEQLLTDVYYHSGMYDGRIG